jgi:hypothetical protein
MLISPRTSSANVLSRSRVLIRMIDTFLNDREVSEARELDLVGVADLTQGDDSPEPVAEVAGLPKLATCRSPQIDL